MNVLRWLGVALACGASSLTGAELGFDPSVIETTTGLKGTRIEAEGVFKITSPRKDLPVTIEGWKMPPFMGLTSWAAFTSGGKSEAMVMGDLVLFEDEVNAVMSAALNRGLEVTALHNHFFFDQPRVYFMHIGGEGKVADLAAGVKRRSTRCRKLVPPARRSLANSACRACRRRAASLRERWKPCWAGRRSKTRAWRNSCSVVR